MTHQKLSETHKFNGTKVVTVRKILCTRKKPVEFTISTWGQELVDCPKCIALTRKMVKK